MSAKPWWKKVVAFWPAVARKVASWLGAAADEANKDGDGKVNE